MSLLFSDRHISRGIPVSATKIQLFPISFPKQSRDIFFRKRKRFFFLLILPLSLLFSCHTSPYEGYTSPGADLYYKLIIPGENETDIQPGNYLLASISYSTLQDSLFFYGTRKFQLGVSSYPGSFSQALCLLREGDSASFILNAENFFHKTLERDLPGFLKEDKKMKLNVRILDIQSKEEFEQEKELFINWARDFHFEEEKRMENYLKANRIYADPEPEGFFILEHIRGEGKRIRKGSYIAIHYEGSRLDGKIIDGTRRSNSPLDFRYGSEMMVIEGINLALGKMYEGSKATLLIPSSLAFGSQGSTGGVVPPFTPLIYKIEVLKVD